MLLGFCLPLLISAAWEPEPWIPPPLQAFDVITNRTLFWQERRRPPPEEVLPEQPAPRVVAVPPLPQLKGVLVNGLRAGAFFDGGFVYEGNATESGWVLNRVLDKQAVLSWGDQEQTLLLE
jgi:hypothetical protein